MFRARYSAIGALVVLGTALVIMKRPVEPDPLQNLSPYFVSDVTAYNQNPNSIRYTKERTVTVKGLNAKAARDHLANLT